MRSPVKYAWVAALFVFALATPASALFCPTDQTMTPFQVLEAGLRSGDQTYDLAFVATVRTVTASGPQQTVDVDLVGVYGMASAPDAAIVTFADPGVAGGSIGSFQVGTSYFIPVVSVGPAGEPNYTTSCDPISVVDDPDTTAVDLAVVAEGAGIDYSLPSQTAGNGSGALVTVVFIAGLLGLFLWTGRRRQASRRQLNATGSDPRPPQVPRL